MCADHYITRLQISTGRLVRKDRSSTSHLFPPKLLDVETGCAEPFIINVVLGQLWLMYSVFMSIFSPRNVIRRV